MTAATWTLFVMTETALRLTPGPAVLFVVAQGLRRGTLASVWGTLGILSGNAVYFAIAATGVGRDAGRLLRDLRGRSIHRRRLPRVARGADVLPGVERGTERGGTTVVEPEPRRAVPKALVFFTALLPPFIDPSDGVAFQMLVLGTTSVVIELIVLLGYGAGAGRLHALTSSTRVVRLVDRVAGTLLVTAGVGLAAVRRP